MRVQSKRHARIARLLGINKFALAVNKMDLVDFDRGVFDRIHADFAELLRGADLHAIPISALLGDNVIARSDNTPWFEGQSLLDYLETVDADRSLVDKPFRFPVQLVLRPGDSFRGYAGEIESGSIRVGETITAWPGGRQARIRRITTWDGDLEMAFAPMSVTLVLDDELDISRGDLLAVGDVHQATRFEAEMVWMDERPLDPARVYVLKHMTRSTAAEVDRPLELNQIGSVVVTASRPLVFDSYTENRFTGCFIVIDPATNFTSGAGMIGLPVREGGQAAIQSGVAERLAQIARRAQSDREAIDAVRQALEEILK
jgi:sulfate adenylyltransferase subunit 1 (EFTu-like GTPase family)